MLDEIFYRWSYGVLLFEMFSFGEVPYALMQTSELREFLESGKRLSQPEYCPTEMYDCKFEIPKLQSDSARDQV